MARSLASRLDRLERLAAELLDQNQGTIYLRVGEAFPGGIDLGRGAKGAGSRGTAGTRRAFARDRAAIASLQATAGNSSAGDRLSKKPSSPHTGLLRSRARLVPYQERLGTPRRMTNRWSTAGVPRGGIV